MRLTALFVLLASSALAADWPQLLGPTRDGHSAEKDLLDAWPARGPLEVWRHDVGAGYAGPVVVGDRLIVYHRVGGDDVVECLSATTGKQQWRVATPTTYRDDYGKGDGPRSTPTVAGGRVYTLGPAGQLLCLDLKTGTKKWAKDLLADYTVRKSYFGVGTSPLAEGKNLLVNVGGEGAGVVALDLETGKARATPPPSRRPSTAFGTPSSSRARGWHPSTRPTARCASPGAGARGSTPRSTPRRRSCWAENTCSCRRATTPGPSCSRSRRTPSRKCGRTRNR
jgi:hypothetical protein